MIGVFILIAVVWLLGAWLVLELAPFIVGESKVGRNAAPVVAALWPIAVCLLIAIAGVGAFEWAWRDATGWMTAPEDRP